MLAQAAALIYFARPVSVDTPADLIAVFPGDAGRIEAGVNLAARGAAPNLLVGGMSPVKSEVKALAARYPDFPADFRLINPATCHDTVQDALATREQIRRHGFTSVILVTSDYHMLRSWVLLKLSLAGTGVRVERFAVPSLNAASTQRSAYLLGAEMVKFWGSLVELTAG